jgi:hypothetical protein
MRSEGEKAVGSKTRAAENKFKLTSLAHTKDELACLLGLGEKGTRLEG